MKGFGQVVYPRLEQEASEETSIAQALCTYMFTSHINLATTHLLKEFSSSSDQVRDRYQSAQLVPSRSIKSSILLCFVQR